MTTSVYFDLDGTLVEYTRSFEDIFSRTVPDGTTDETIEAFSDRILAGIRTCADAPFERAARAVCERDDLDVDPVELANRYVETEIASTRVVPAVRPLLRTLSKHHRTGVLTNGDGRMQRRKLAAHGLDELVDTVVVSNEVGVRKPAPGIFEEAKRRLPAETYVYVGDTYDEDVVPAREHGFQTVYVGDDRRDDAPVAANGTDELATLLLTLLESPGES